jgi:hypothetical protein
MSDSTGHRRDETAPADKPWKKDTRNVPPLVWVIVIALLAVIVVAFLYARGTMSTPEGGEMPVAGSDMNVQPPQPATAAPATAEPAAAPAPAGGG